MTGARMSDDLRVDDDDWFGEGSSFDSGEELAAALAAFGTAPEAAPPDASLDGAQRGAHRRELNGLEQPAPGDGSIAGAPGEPGFPQGREPRSAPSGGGEGAGRSGPPRRAAQGLDASSWPTISAQSAAPPQRRAGPRDSKSGWRIRQGVRSLRQAEQALERLREDAIMVAWAAAAAALRRAGR